MFWRSPAFAAIKGQNLLRPMITGTKVMPASVAAPRSGSPARAALLLLGCAAATASWSTSCERRQLLGGTT